MKMSKEEGIAMLRAVSMGARLFNLKTDRKGYRLAGEPGIGGAAYSPLTANALLGFRFGQYRGVVAVLTQEPQKLEKMALDVEGKATVADLPLVTRRSLGLDGTPWNDLILAMAYAKLGEVENACEKLEEAVERIEAWQRLTWAERLELRILQSEAEVYLAEAASRAGP
jgi:hypothetical protein